MVTSETGKAVSLYMAGIYLHIPFCKKACHYCDFYFTTSLKYKDDLLKCMHIELELQKEYLAGHKIETIYFGGGTPSLIGADEIQRFIDKITSLFEVTDTAEITLEANPDDLTPESVKALRQTQVNRFSVGVQSFYEEDLLWMNRAHNASEAESSLKRIQDAGFENITADLIYGFPLLSNPKWMSNIDKIVSLEIPHISAYSMTVEDKTALAAFIRKGKQKGMNDAQSAEQFLILSQTLASAGYEHYEISNFAFPERYSKHNSNYWFGVPYLGIGPSSHSFDGRNRQWNIANNAKYMEKIGERILPAEKELLSQADRLNEYLMTGLRTMWGIDLDKINAGFGSDYAGVVSKGFDQFAEKGWVSKEGKIVRLTSEGKLFADNIAAELFVDPI